MIMANKQDMQGAITAENLFSELELEQFMVTKKDIYYQGCSAKTGEGIWEGVKVLSEAMTNLENSSSMMSQRNSVLDGKKEIGKQ